MSRTIAPANLSATQQTVKPAPCWHPAELRRITAHWVDAGATAAQLRLLHALLFRVDTTGETFASQYTLADDTGTSRRSVRVTLAELAELGLITETADDGGPVRPRVKTLRRLIYPPADALTADDELELMIGALELDGPPEPPGRVTRLDDDPEPELDTESAGRVTRPADEKSARVTRPEVLTPTGGTHGLGFGDEGSPRGEGDQPAPAPPAPAWSDASMAAQANTRRHLIECRTAVRSKPKPKTKPAPPAASKGDWSMSMLAGMAATRAGNPPSPSGPTPTVEPCPTSSAPVETVASRTASDG